MNIVTWNIQSGTGSRLAIEWLLTWGADVILLQEAAERGDQVGESYQIERRMGTRSRPGIAYRGMRHIWHPGYQGGTAIVCRSEVSLHPIPSDVFYEPSEGQVKSPGTSGASRSLPDIYTVPSPKGEGERGILCAMVEIGKDSKLLLCNIHAWSPSGRDWDAKKKSLKNRIDALHQRANRLFDDKVYLVVGGDFNAAAERCSNKLKGKQKTTGRSGDASAHILQKGEKYILPGASHFSGGSLDGFYINCPSKALAAFGVREESTKGDHFPCWIDFESDIEEDAEITPAATHTFILTKNSEEIHRWNGEWKKLSGRLCKITGWSLGPVIENGTGYRLIGWRPGEPSPRDGDIHDLSVKDGTLVFRTGVPS